MQIKTTKKFYLILARMVKFNNTSDSLGWLGCIAKGKHLYCRKYKDVQPLLKSIWWIHRKLRIHLPQDQHKPFPNIYPNDTVANSKDTCSPVLIVALFLIARNWKETRYTSPEERVKTMCYIYTIMYYLTARKVWNHVIFRQENKDFMT